MDYYRFLFIFLFLVPAWFGSMADVYRQPSSNEEALAMLDNLLDNRLEFQAGRQSSIDSLKSGLVQVTSYSRRMELLDSIATLYEYFQLDSAITYRKLASKVAIANGDVSFGNIQLAKESEKLTEVGETSRAISLFESINPDEIADSQQLSYHESGARLLTSFGYYYPVDTLRHSFREQAQRHIDSIISLAQDSTVVYQIALAQRYFNQGKSALVVGCLTSVLDAIEPSHSQYSDAARLLGMFYRSQGKFSQAIYYLTLASISDIRNGTRDSRAMMSLAELLYNSGDVARAYACLRVSLDNSVNSGANMYSMEAARQVPMVAGAFREQDKRKVVMLIMLAVVLLVLLIIIVVILVYLRKEMNSMNQMKQNVIEANKMKETYISHFLNLCSIYLEKLDEFSRMAKRKITAGQVDDLYEMIRSGKMMDEQSRIFYEKFDNAFTHIFPDFVDGVNMLLQPDKQIMVPSDGRLTTELRILAFARLGIDDAGQIARFLGLSLNTIYTYRNKMRSKAKDRSTFEADIMAIGQIS